MVRREVRGMQGPSRRSIGHGTRRTPRSCRIPSLTRPFGPSAIGVQESWARIQMARSALIWQTPTQTQEVVMVRRKHLLVARAQEQRTGQAGYGWYRIIPAWIVTVSFTGCQGEPTPPAVPPPVQSNNPSVQSNNPPLQTNTPPLPTSSQAELDPGFRVFPTPRTFDGPGTLFRIDQKGTKYSVGKLNARVDKAGSETLPSSMKNVSWSASALVTFLGVARKLQDIKGSADLNSALDSTISFGEGERETTYDADVDKALREQQSSFKHWADSRYFVIRETISVSSVNIVVDRSGSARVEAKAAVTKLVDGHGGINWNSSSRDSLVKEFSTPHRIFYTAEEILAPSSGLEDDAKLRRFRLKPGDELTWEKEDRDDH